MPYHLSTFIMFHAVPRGVKSKEPTKKASKRKADAEKDEQSSLPISNVNRLMGGGLSGNIQIPPEMKPNEEEKEQTVSMVKFKKTKEDYQKRIDKLETKNKEQSEELKALRKEKKDAEAKAEKFRKENEKLREQAEAKKGASVQDADTISELRKTISQLEKDMKTIEEDSQMDLKKDLQDARDKIEELEATVKEKAQRIKDLEDNVEELKNDRAEAERKLEEALKESPRTRIDEPESAGTIRREGLTVFSSNLFISPRYDVKMAKSRKYIAFEPNINGTIACVDNRLDIPDLDSHIGYQGQKDHTAMRKGTRLVIYL